LDSPDTPGVNASISPITYENGEIRQNISSQSPRLLIKHFSNIDSTNRQDPLAQAKLILEQIPKLVYDHVNVHDEPELNIPNEYNEFVWFLIPKDVIPKLIDEYIGTTRNPGVSFQPK